MFGKKSTPPPPPSIEQPQQLANNGTANARPVNTSDPNALNILVKGTVVEGTVSSESDIRVDGIIKGNLSCKARVIIGTTGFVDGEISCESAVIEGKFYGKIKVIDTLSVKETAEVVGDVRTDKLLVQPGAIFNVTCNMKNTPENASKSQKNGVPA
ncbi:MAG: hypothetical protein RL757_2926 [Bacteroidota bacterium]|jgi:cytoskeletal protein CcmA (bactofilin family)